jgi:Ca-activated chloride channel family protein
LYEVIPVGVRSTVPIHGIDSLSYQTPPAQTTAASGNELMFVKLRYKQPTGDTSILLDHPVPNRLAQASDDFMFATAIAEFGMILRDSEYKQNSTLEDVVSLARRSMGEDLFGYRGDFLRLVQAYERLR